jgi:hypothetical protein
MKDIVFSDCSSSLSTEYATENIFCRQLIVFLLMFPSKPCSTSGEFGKDLKDDLISDDLLE